MSDPPLPLPPPVAGSAPSTSRRPAGPRARPVRGMAMAALLCGIAGLVLFVVLIPAIVAVVLGAVALAWTRVAPDPSDGRGWAIAGLVCGIVGVAAFAGLVAYGIVLDWGEEQVSSNELEVGQCVELDAAADEISTLPVVSCDVGHQGEVFFVGDVAEAGIDVTAFPGDEAMARRVADHCTGEPFEAYVGTRYLRSELEVTTLSPSADSWRLGDRTLVCLAVRPDGGELDWSVRGSGD